MALTLTLTPNTRECTPSVEIYRTIRVLYYTVRTIPTYNAVYLAMRNTWDAIRLHTTYFLHTA
jgi:hypothetical protein